MMRLDVGRGDMGRRGEGAEGEFVSELEFGVGVEVGRGGGHHS